MGGSITKNKVIEQVEKCGFFLRDSEDGFCESCLTKQLGSWEGVSNRVKQT